MKRRDIALDLYNSFKSGKRSFFVKPKTENTRENNEPKTVGELIEELVEHRQWQSGLAEGEIFVKWREIVGEEIAAHSEPVEIKDGKLFISCSSTAWATQLNLVKMQLLQSIQTLSPGITALEIFGPNAPSWRKGLRTIQGAKGPRDTYG